MCRLEHWLCCICEDAYVAVNFFCGHVAPGAPACLDTTRYERHIVARYCYFCSNVGLGGAPVLSKTKEYLDNLASLEGMLRVAAIPDRNDVTVSVFSNWLMGFNGPTSIRPFKAGHPAINSNSTKDHFAHNLSPPQKVASFIVTSSEMSRASAFHYQIAIPLNLTVQPYFRPPVPVLEQGLVGGQPGRRTDKGTRRWSNRTHRMVFAKMDQQDSSSSLPNPSNVWPRDAAKPDITMPNEKHLPISFTPVDSDDIDIRATASSNDLKGKQIVTPLASAPTFAGNYAKSATVDCIGQPVATSYATVASSAPTSPVVFSADTVKDDRIDKQEGGKPLGIQRPTRSTAVIPVIPLVPIAKAKIPRGSATSQIASTPGAVATPIVTPTAAPTQTKAKIETPAPTSSQVVVVSAKVNVEKAKASTSKYSIPKDTLAAPREEDEQRSPVLPEAQKKPLLYSQAITTGASSATIPTGLRGHSIDHTKSQDNPKKKDLVQKGSRNSRPKRKGQKQKRGQKKQQERTQELEPKPAPKLESRPEPKSKQEPEYHQFRLPCLSYRDALKGSLKGNTLPSSSKLHLPSY
ncbi:hypothetical protein F4813DRAFT_391229 [Daldinia decipiens]|uniref:uncharacterized protein n=1 Tax=Daldinia decipiens TaxID=326647 RepID=UPI0020C5B1AC|nr:uncharacterized protein F4813DRAFT_391229 [Daldinia decipiens]KAI1655949.1 hypothetical protein F4813DRAFT_391229 [Daldinia decipiens]